MEDDAAFNAGYGSMPNEECNVEMDAAVMDGKNRSYGSVAILGVWNNKKIFGHNYLRINEFRIFTFVYLSFNAIEGFANPIYVAEKVLTSSSACMLASYGAKRFAQKHGFQEVSNDKLLAPETVLAYQQWKQDKPDGKRINEAGGLGAV